MGDKLLLPLDRQRRVLHALAAADAALFLPCQTVGQAGDRIPINVDIGRGLLLRQVAPLHDHIQEVDEPALHPNSIADPAHFEAVQHELAVIKRFPLQIKTVGRRIAHPAACDMAIGAHALLDAGHPTAEQKRQIEGPIKGAGRQLVKKMMISRVLCQNVPHDKGA